MKGARLLLAASLAFLPAVQPLRAGDHDYDQLVSHLRARYHKAPMGGGFMGFLARCFSPKGISGLHMAVFEDLESSHQPLGEDFDAFVEKTVGPDRTPFVRVRNRNGERVYVYLTEKGPKAELLLVAAETDQAVVMKMKLDPARLAEWMARPEGMARGKGHRKHGKRGPEGAEHREDPGGAGTPEARNQGAEGPQEGSAD